MGDAAAQDAEGESIRTCLKMIRSLDTLPGDILPNGKTASHTAHEYVMNGKIKRYVHKRRDGRQKRPYGQKKKRAAHVRPAN